VERIGAVSGSGSPVADLAVVGGGVIGAFVAQEARRLRPDWRVLLLERSAIGAGATGWSAGVRFPLAATEGHRALVRGSAAGYARLRNTVADAFVRPVPMVYVVRRDGLAALRSRFVGVVPRPVTDGERKRILEILPDLDLAPDDELLTHDGHGFAVRARVLAEALLGAPADGIEVQLGQQVDAVEPDGSGYRLWAARGDWAARRVVLACGPWTPPATLPVVPGARRKRIAALYARLPVHPGDPLVYFVDDDVFVLPLGTGSALVSFYRDEWDTDPDSCDGRASGDDLCAGIAALGRRSTRAAAAVTGGRAFCDLYTDNRLPVVLHDPAVPGIGAVRGCSGSGVRLAPGLATEAVRAVLAGTPEGGNA
jgi:glycine/D-amino acid oxidase-like deaminating enzyme